MNFTYIIDPYSLGIDLNTKINVHYGIDLLNFNGER